MKRIICIVISIVFVVMLSSCSSNEESVKQENMNYSLFSETPIDVRCVATISTETLAIETPAGVFTFDGKPVQDEESSRFHFGEYFEEMCKAGMLCHQDPVELTIHFSEEIPSQLMWSQCFYRASTGSFPAQGSQEFITVENVGKDIVLQLGNSVSTLYASPQTEPTYRIVRILCQYESKKAEYDVIFDGRDFSNN